jgi:outer membrane lipoprotein-sorting protein
MKRPFLLFWGMLLLAGCAAPPPRENLPAVQWSTDAEALHILRDRADAVKTVTATGDITLSRRSGDSVRLDLAMVAQNPGHLRLRAWKLGRAVFDLTLTPEGLWLLTPDDPSLKQKARSGGLDAAQLARSWATFSGALFDRADLTLHRGDRALEVTAPSDDATIFCHVDNRTLTPRQYEVKDPSGVTRFTLRLSGYRTVDGIPYATRYDATSDSGTIRIDLRDVELNTDLAPAAFTPPRRAEKVS